MNRISKECVAAGVIALKLVRNGLRYRCLRLLGRPGRPQAISLEITHACICRCVMCNIWKIPRSVPDLPLEKWKEILSDDLLTDLRELDITGGEPFLRDDLATLVRHVCGLKGTHFKRLRSVAITTNGILTDRVIAGVAGMLEPLKASGIELVIVCAFDVVGSLHDQIRRHPGAWIAVDRTIAGLVELRDRYPNLVVGLKTTVLPQNVRSLDEIAKYAGERGLFTIISPGIITGGRYLNPEKESQLELGAADREHLARFYEGSGFKWSYHAAALAGYLRTGEMKKPCTCGFNYFFVRSTGEMHLCPLIEETVGTVAAASPARLFSSTEARRIRRLVGRLPECRRCTEPGLERYSLPYEGLAYARMLISLGLAPFLELHRHLGLDKYV